MFHLVSLLLSSAVCFADLAVSKTLKQKRLCLCIYVHYMYRVCIPVCVYVFVCVYSHCV